MSALPLEPGEHAPAEARTAARSVIDPPTSPAQLAARRRALRGKVDGVGAVLAGGANVVLQLARPEVARGVLESTVTSGSVRHHPLKRTRTTLTYLAVAMYGDDETRAAYREAVDGSHRQVRSAPGAEVRYNAFDRELQLWVASCLYFGARDMAVRMHGPLDAESETSLLDTGRRFATTLQVPDQMWHRDVAAFEDYWARGLARAEMDAETVRFLRSVMDASVLPPPVSWALRPVVRFFNTGFLPAPLRHQLGLQWSGHDDLVHAAALRLLGTALTPLPDVLRAFPFNLLLADVALRRRLGLRLV
jgi:uncharacterized protein (DUF2236 family)